MKLYSIETGNFKLDGGAMFGVVPKSIWQKTYPANEHNLCPLAMRCLLIEDGDRLILADTGIGAKQSEKFLSYYHLHGEHSLDKSLAAHGFSKDDITDVFLTHLHLDHAGGAAERKNQALLPAFKNAVYWSSEDHWNWAIHPNEREKASFLTENILPIQESGQLQFVPKNQKEFHPGFNVLFTYGHTDAMMLPILRYKGQTIFFAADLIPTASHIPIPYVASYDVYPLKAMEEKKEFLTKICNDNSVLFFEHDALIECCTLQETEKGIRMKETFRLEDV